MQQPKPRILCIDDEPEAAEVLGRRLGDDFECELAVGADAALEKMAQSGPFAIVVTDFTLQGMNGPHLLQAVRARWPHTIGILIAAREDMEVAVPVLNEGNAYRIIRKPWETAALRRAVNEALDYWRLVQGERALREQLASTNADLDDKVRELDEANEMLEYWVEFSPAVLYSLSRERDELRPSYISKNFFRLTGFERTQAIVETTFWTSLVHPDDRQRYREAIASLLAGNELHAVLEYRVRHRDGNYIVVLDTVRAEQDGDGHTVELIGAWTDVSARR